MPELVVGLFVGVWLGMDAGFDPNGAAIVGGVAAVLAYLASCAIYPWRDCFLCHGRQHSDDGRGNFRPRWGTCLWCRSQRPNRRLGARLIGRG